MRARNSCGDEPGAGVVLPTRARTSRVSTRVYSNWLTAMQRRTSARMRPARRFAEANCNETNHSQHSGVYHAKPRRASKHRVFQAQETVTNDHIVESRGEAYRVRLGYRSWVGRCASPRKNCARPLSFGMGNRGRNECASTASWSCILALARNGDLGASLSAILGGDDSRLNRVFRRV